MFASTSTNGTAPGAVQSCLATTGVPKTVTTSWAEPDFSVKLTGAEASTGCQEVSGSDRVRSRGTAVSSPLFGIPSGSTKWTVTVAGTAAYACVRSAVFDAATVTCRLAANTCPSLMNPSW